MALTLPEGIQQWPITTWQNGHQNFKVRFKKNASFKLVLPASTASRSEQYRATTGNFMWLIQYAIDNNLHLRAMGNGWSFSEVAVSDGGVVDTKSLVLSFDLNDSFTHPSYLAQGKKSRDLFFAQCGMSILRAEELLQQSGRSLKASGASNAQSLAGATSTGTHGSAYQVGAVHDTIIGLHLVTGPNRHVWLERASNPVASDAFIDWLGAERISDDHMFNAAVVSFGSFGFIHGILLETEPLFLLEEHRSGEIPYNQPLIKAITDTDFSGIADVLPYPEESPGKTLYHFEVLINPHDFEPGNAAKGVYLKTLYKLPYRADYPRIVRDIKGFTYGDNTLGLAQTILDALGPRLSAPLVPLLVNTMMPLAFKAVPPTTGTLGETFHNTKFRGKAASGAIAVSRSDAAAVTEVILSINKTTPFPGALALRFVKGSAATLAFTKFPATCILELDGVDCKQSRSFFEAVCNKLEELQLQYTLHWGKFNFNLTPGRISAMYGTDALQNWKHCRHTLLDYPARNVFTNPFLVRCGLDG